MTSGQDNPQLAIYDHAVGPCIVCEEESEGSMYWLPLLPAQWDVIRPYIEEISQVSPHSGVKLVMNLYFFPGLSRPFCGPKCVGAHYENVAADHCKNGG